jgi:hypothetical protein
MAGWLYSGANAGNSGAQSGGSFWRDRSSASVNPRYTAPNGGSGGNASAVLAFAEVDVSAGQTIGLVIGGSGGTSNVAVAGSTVAQVSSNGSIITNASLNNVYNPGSDPTAGGGGSGMEVGTFTDNLENYGDPPSNGTTGGSRNITGFNVFGLSGITYTTGGGGGGGGGSAGSFNLGGTNYTFNVGTGASGASTVRGAGGSGGRGGGNVTPNNGNAGGRYSGGGGGGGLTASLAATSGGAGGGGGVFIYFR